MKCKVKRKETIEYVYRTTLVSRTFPLDLPELVSRIEMLNTSLGHNYTENNNFRSADVLGFHLCVPDCKEF